MDVFKSFLPVVWLLVATGVGLALYQTSDAFFESFQKNATKRRRLRLTGSVVIAAVAFYGLYQVTPSATLNPVPAGYVQLEQQLLQRVVDRAQQLQDRLVVLNGCLSVQGPSRCVQEATDMQMQANAVEQAAAQLLPAGDE